MLHYREVLASDDELVRWFGDGSGRGVAVLTGTDAHLFCIDFDIPDMMLEYREAIKREAPELYDRIKNGACMVQTRSGGFHLYLQTDGPPPGNIKLAYKHLPTDKDGEVRGDPGRQLYYPGGGSKGYPLVSEGIFEKCGIETRGTGGYAQTYPSTGYRALRGGLATLCVFSDSEVSLLLS